MSNINDEYGCWWAVYGADGTLMLLSPLKEIAEDARALLFGDEISNDVSKLQRMDGIDARINNLLTEYELE